MKNTLLLTLFAFGAWSYYTSEPNATPNSVGNTLEPTKARMNLPINSTQTTFNCDGRQYCSQMTSRAEAEYFTKYCPNTKMDGDGDGTPCENDSRF